MRSLFIVTVTTIALAGCGAPSTADFVQKAAVSDMYEVQAGKLAAEKGQSDAVKKFGQQMVDAHTKTTEELTGIVKTKNIKVDLPTKLDAKHQKLIDDLNSASARDFDKMYANQQVDAATQRKESPQNEEVTRHSSCVLEDGSLQGRPKERGSSS
jgi:predicted outer membrane protein